MAKTLGIYVTSDEHMDKLINVCKAAKRKGVETKVFFTHTGARLAKHPRLSELDGLAHLMVCNVGFEANNLERPVPEIDDKDFATQARHGEMIEECDRYLSL
jgi:peroxiredoxin family protein